MANVDNPHGLQPRGRTLSGGCPAVESYTKDANEAAAIFVFDAVHMQNDANIAAAGASPGTTLYLGVALNHGAAASLTNHLVVVSPDALFEAQDNNDTDGVAAADIGLNGNIELNAGSATTKLSGHELDESTYNTTATLDVKLLRLLAVPDNAFGAFARIEIVFNKHMYATGVAGI